MTLEQAPARSPNAALLVRLHLAGMTGVLCWGFIMLAFGNHAGALIKLIYLLLLIPSVLWVHMGGVEAARLLRQRDPGALIIASSGYVSDRALSDYRAHGFDAVLRKPYRLEELRDTVETLLGARAPAAEA